MVRLKAIGFFCDECGMALSTGYMCAECKRVLCHSHYYGEARGPFRRKDGLCVRCAQKVKVISEEAQQA